MTSETYSGSPRHDVWKGRLRRLRFFGVLLLIALLLVGGNAARISLARLGSSSRDVSALFSSLEPRPADGPRFYPDFQLPKSPVVSPEASRGEEEDLSAVGPSAAVRGYADNGPSGGLDVSEQEDYPTIVVDASEAPNTTGRLADAESQAVPESARASSVDASRLISAVERVAHRYRVSLAGNWSRLGDCVMRAASWGESLASRPARGNLDADHGIGNRLSRQPQAAEYSATVSQGLPRPASILLSNSANSGGEVRFLVDGEFVLLRPGESHEFGRPGPWLIQFHRGGDFGNAEHTLSDGSYVFRVTSTGWDLERASSPDSP